MPEPINSNRTVSVSVLVVEDDLLIALDLQMMLEDAGHHVLGPVDTVEKALSLLERVQPDVVLLDLNLRGKLATPVAERLRTLGIPFIVASADASVVRGEAAFAGVVELTKPVQPSHLLAAVDNAAS